MYRAAFLNGQVYEDLRQDPIAFVQGITVVVLATLALLIGAFIHQAGTGGNVAEALSALMAMPAMWIIQGLSAYVLGSMAIPHEERPGLARPLIAAIGLSAAPGVLFLFVGVPVAGGFIGLLVTFWMVLTMVTAVQRTLNIPGFRATLTVLPGFVLRFIIFGMLAGGGGS